MFVSSPKLYLKPVTHGMEFIPVWLPEQSATMEYPDVWEERRLAGAPYSAIYHAKLPDSAIIPPQDLEGAAQLPCWWENGVITEYPVATSTKVVGASYYQHKTFGSEPGWAVTQVLTRLYRGFYELYVGGYTEFRAQSFHDGIYADWYKREFNVSGDRLQYLTPPDLADALDCIHNFSWTIRRDWYSMGSYKILECKPMPEESLKAHIDYYVSSADRFCGKAMVSNHSTTIKETDILGRPTGKVVKQPPRGSPLHNGYASELLNRGMAMAYSDALEDFPIVSKNSLQNIASILQPLSHFVWDYDTTVDAIDELIKSTSSFRVLDTQKFSLDLPDIPEYSKSAWLGGRYVWSTSVSDAQQGYNYLLNELLRMIGTRSDEVKCHGKCEIDDITFQCTFQMRERALDGIAKFLRDGYQLGLEPNAYVLWDFIPFSFVFDWFVPIGDTLNAYTTAHEFCPLYYEYISIYGDYSFCYSASYRTMTAIGPIEVYVRWYERTPPNVESSYFVLENTHASSKIECWRFVDALCLLL